MLRRPRAGAHVEITQGSLIGMRGTVINGAKRRRGKVSIHLDPPSTWAGHTIVRVRVRKLRTIRAERSTSAAVGDPTIA